MEGSHVCALNKKRKYARGVVELQQSIMNTSRYNQFIIWVAWILSCDEAHNHTA